MGLRSKSAVNNWNPWINSNCLACTLLMENRTERRAALAAKVLRSLDRFLDSYHEDGGCDEGPGYWGRAGASLFDNLELLDSASGGAVRYWETPLLKEIGRYIHRVHIADDWFVKFADAAAKPGIAADLVCRYGERIGDELKLTRWLDHESGSDVLPPLRGRNAGGARLLKSPKQNRNEMVFGERRGAGTVILREAPA